MARSGGRYFIVDGKRVTDKEFQEMLDVSDDTMEFLESKKERPDEEEDE